MSNILGTSITCTAIGRSRIRKVSVTFSTCCGTGGSRICTKGQMSAMCSKKCRSSPACGPRGTPRQGGREPPWERGASGTPPCGSTRTSPPDRAIATAIRSWRRNERSRRTLLPVPPPSPTRAAITKKPPVRASTRKGHLRPRQRVFCAQTPVRWLWWLWWLWFR